MKSDIFILYVLHDSGVVIELVLVEYVVKKWTTVKMDDIYKDDERARENLSKFKKKQNFPGASATKVPPMLSRNGTYMHMYMYSCCFSSPNWFSIFHFLSKANLFVVLVKEKTTQEYYNLQLICWREFTRVGGARPAPVGVLCPLRYLRIFILRPSRRLSHLTLSISLLHTHHQSYSLQW